VNHIENPSSVVKDACLLARYLAMDPHVIMNRVTEAEETNNKKKSDALKQKKLIRL
jgi:hypothetical protein